ncbi:Lipase [Leucoagaricus sp. SymC.cos]|nr:Lipase [Leucoagaricus sp. SymC.cos]
MFNSYLFSTLFLAISYTKVCSAGPLLTERLSPTELSQAQMEGFAPFTHFARVAYCQPSAVKSWSCGAECKANSDFILVEVGGDGLTAQGYSPSQQSVIVAHQESNPVHIEPWITYAGFLPKSLDPSLFPGIPDNILVHSGFANDYTKSAAKVLDVVIRTVSDYKATKVTTVGHSLGGALALLDGVYLPLHMSGGSFRTITNGMPRVGNQALADYVDTDVSMTHINNRKETIPLLPPRFLGFEHSSGEIHITEDGDWVSCPGHDNPDAQCTAGALETNLFDHYGPYGGDVMMGGKGCQPPA